MTARSIFRSFHLILAIPIVGYVYSPFDKLPQYAFLTRYVFLPLIVISGLWMWKGHIFRSLLSKTPAAQRTMTTEN
jgi:thiosulfate reductase cytochrome b subunit